MTKKKKMSRTFQAIILVAIIIALFSVVSYTFILVDTENVNFGLIEGDQISFVYQVGSSGITDIIVDEICVDFEGYLDQIPEPHNAQGYICSYSDEDWMNDHLFNSVDNGCWQDSCAVPSSVECTNALSSGSTVLYNGVYFSVGCVTSQRGNYCNSLFYSSCTSNFGEPTGTYDLGNAHCRYELDNFFDAGWNLSVDSYFNFTNENESVEGLNMRVQDGARQISVCVDSIVTGSYGLDIFVKLVNDSYERVYVNTTVNDDSNDEVNESESETDDDQDDNSVDSNDDVVVDEQSLCESTGGNWIESPEGSVEDYFCDCSSSATLSIVFDEQQGCVGTMEDEVSITTWVISGLSTLLLIGGALWLIFKKGGKRK